MTTEVHDLRVDLIEKAERSRRWWHGAVLFYKWVDAVCVLVLLTCPAVVAVLPRQLHPYFTDVLTVMITVAAGFQAKLQPGDRKARNTIFRDEAEDIYRRAYCTADPDELLFLYQEFHVLERRYHSGDQPWPVRIRRFERIVGGKAGDASPPRHGKAPDEIHPGL